MSTLKIDEIVHNLDKLRKLCYHNLAVRITNIEDYLSTLTERVNQGSVIVTGAFNQEKISPLNISESELVQVYNDVPRVLFKNALVVELSAKSYRNPQDGEPILLENDINGKYWMIITGIDQFFLVPSINIKLNIHKLKTVRLLFNFRGDTPSADSHFMLVKPATVSSQASGKLWQVQQRGILEFINPSSPVPREPERKILELEQKFLEISDAHAKAETLDLEIKNMAKELEYLKLELHDSQQERQKLESQIKDIIDQKFLEVSDAHAKAETLDLEIKNMAKELEYLKLELHDSQQERQKLESQIKDIIDQKFLEVSDAHAKAQTLDLEIKNLLEQNSL